MRQNGISILTDDFDHCYLCGGRAQCAHHIFGGPLRKISTANGFIVPLCHACHNMSDKGVHFNEQLSRMLKAEAQKEYEKEHSHDEFMKLIGRNYL
jgi:hypothetical protein